MGCFADRPDLNRTNSGSTKANKENQGIQFELALAFFPALGASLNSELNQNRALLGLKR